MTAATEMFNSQTMMTKEFPSSNREKVTPPAACFWNSDLFRHSSSGLGHCP
jgi:hypothetical protein